jgi:hypothetical protein
VSDEIREQIIRDLNTAQAGIEEARTSAEVTVAVIDSISERLRTLMDETTQVLPSASVSGARDHMIHMVQVVRGLTDPIGQVVEAFNLVQQIVYRHVTSVVIVTDGTGDTRPEEAVGQMGICQISWSNATSRMLSTAELLRESITEVQVGSGEPIVEKLQEAAAALRQAEDDHHAATTSCDKSRELIQSYIIQKL